MDFAIDRWSVTVLLVALGAITWGVRAIRHRLQEQRYLEELAEMEFEQTVIGTSSAPSQIYAVEEDQRFISSSYLQSAASTITSSQPVNSVSAGGINELLAKLEAGRLVKNHEGYVELHGDPQAMVLIRLKNNKTALLVPNLESEAFLRRNIKRADIIIMRASDGNAYSIRRVEDEIADLL